MHILKLMIIFCLYVLFSSCQKETPPNISMEDNLSNQAIIHIGKKLEKKYNLLLTAVGGGAKDGIWLLTAGFTRHGKNLNLEESRELIVKIVQEYLENINDNRELKPYLKVYPFTPSNLCIYVINLDSDGEEVKDPHIGSMSANKDVINYSTNDPFDRYKYKFDYYETFEEAVAKLHQKGAL